MLPDQPAAAGIWSQSHWQQPSAFPSKCQSRLQRLKQSLQCCLHLNICLSDRHSNRHSPLSEYAGPSGGAQIGKKATKIGFFNKRHKYAYHTFLDTHVHMKLNAQAK